MLCVIGAALALPSASIAQDVLWQRQVQGHLGGVEMAFYHGGAEYTKPVIADLDGDGDGDLYVGEYDGYINVFENLGGNPPNWYCLTTALDSMDVGQQNAPTFWDIDLDGDLDLFMGEEDGNIWYYRNDGTATAPSWTFQTNNYGLILVDHHSVPFFHDLDADGDDDLLVGHNNGGAALFVNAGSPGSPLWSFQGAFYEGFDIGSKAAECVFDVNDDSLGDYFLGGLDGQIHYYPNEGPPQDPIYADSGAVFDVSHNAAPTFWDFDGDGDLDLLSGEADGNINLLTNSGLPSRPDWHLTDEFLAYFDAGFYSMPAVVDIDNDDDLDLFIGRVPAAIIFLENVGNSDSAAWQLNSTFYDSINLPNQEAPAFADLDGDGDLDMLIGCEDGTLFYYRNIGTPQTPDWDVADSNYANVDVGYNSAPAFADVDGDGLVDLLIGSYEGTLRYLRNDGSSATPIWTDLGYYAGIDVGSYSAPAVADLDADGDLDLLIGSGGLTGNISLYRNQGTPLLPLWSLETAYYQGWDFGDYASPCAADLDGDGDPDLLIGCESGGLYYMRNLGLLFDVEMALLPYNPPIVIPPEGGSFQYLLRVENNESQPMLLTLWTELTLPNGQTFGPLVSFQQTIPPGVTSQLETQAIGDTFPAGQYTCTGYVGADSVLIYSTDSFTFAKDDTVGVLNPNGDSDSRPVDFHLSAPRPNPFNAATVIEYALPLRTQVELRLLDVMGRQLQRVQLGWQEAGEHAWKLKADELTSGIYFLQLQTREWSGLQKLCLLR